MTVARLRHVSSYSWLQGVLDHCQDNMMAFDGQVGRATATQSLTLGAAGVAVLPCILGVYCWQGFGMAMQSCSPGTLTR